MWYCRSIQKLYVCAYLVVYVHLCVYVYVCGMFSYVSAYASWCMRMHVYMYICTICISKQYIHICLYDHTQYWSYTIHSEYNHSQKKLHYMIISIYTHTHTFAKTIVHALYNICIHTLTYTHTCIHTYAYLSRYISPCKAAEQILRNICDT